MSLNSLIDSVGCELASITAPQGVLVVSPDGSIQFATARAEHWIRDSFVAVSPLNRLPEALTRWLCNGASGIPSKFVLERPRGNLSVRVVCHEPQSVCLLLQEQPGNSGTASRDIKNRLTRRENEVLSWVALGKTNEEVGLILGVKTRTIAKHLERIFPKLGVENRTAAAQSLWNRDVVSV
jgi:DNA-binding CsgD family transcriptional regulator